MNAPKATIDFETRSACDLKKHGTWRYSIHPTTEVLCLCFRLPDWKKGRVEWWHPALPSLDLPEDCSDPTALSELQAYVRSGQLVEAHNVWFECCIWQNVLVARHGWDPIPLESWRCSAAKAATHALPRALDKVAQALRLRVQKDMDGHKLMKKMSKPRKSRKAERKVWDAAGLPHPTLLYHESPEMLARLIQYCEVDVLTEEAVSHRLADLSPSETELFLLDLRINQRGFQIDRYAVRMALQLVHRESVLLNQQLAQLTDGAVRKATNRQRILRWFEENGLWLPNTQAGTLDDTLKFAKANPDLISPLHRDVLTIVRALGRSSTAKYVAMKRWWDTRSGRVHGGLLYHGASTGRWSGKGIQPHNFPKGTARETLDDGTVLKKADMARLWAGIKRGDRRLLIERFSGVMEALSTALRGAIVSARGHTLFVADYAAIEARVLLWVAGEEEALGIFRRGEDIYCDMASSIYGYPCNPKDHAGERALGKVAVLGLGYQMGASKFFATCELFGIPITEELAEAVVQAYRAKYWRVKELWYAQEAAAIEAVETKQLVKCGVVEWFTYGLFLYCRLPSGRCLAYAYPEIRQKRTPWGETAAGLSFMGVDSKTHQWRRQTSYGGLLVENIVQAISRDIMAEAMLRCEANGYPVILSVHDELISEAPHGTIDEYVALLTEIPTWATGCPIAAEGWAGVRYRK